MRPILVILCFVSVVLPQSNNGTKSSSNALLEKPNINEEMPGSNYGNTLKLVESQIPNALSGQVFNTNWTLQSTVSVSDSYNGEPRNINETSLAEPINIARNNAYIYGTAGCGPLSLYSTLEYFSSYFWLDNLLYDKDGNSSYVNLATKVISSTKTYSIDDQVVTSPKDMVYAFNRIMTDSDYNNILKATIHKDLQNNVSETMELFKSSIDIGIPVIWWCHLDDNAQYNHYMVVYAYENWSGHDTNGNSITYPVFKIRYNLQDTFEEYYIYPEMLTYINGAITFDYHKTMYRFKDNSITAIQYYPFLPVNYSLVNGGETVSGSYLRTGYITAPDGIKHLVLSPRRANAGQAYISLHFPTKVRHLYTYMALWGSSERLDFINDSFYIEILDGSGEWVKNDTLPLHLLTTDKNNPNYYHFMFIEETQDIRIVVNSQAIGDDNKGRIVLHNLLFIEALEENCEKRFINKYAEIENVQNNTTVYVASCDKAFVEAMGILLTSTYSNPNYYSYIAKPNGPKKIINIRRLYNDLDSLLFITAEIENFVESYGMRDVKNETLAYIRTISDSYLNDFHFGLDLWAIFAGSFDTILFDLIDNNYQHGMYFADYFYSFLSLSNRNFALHGYKAGMVSNYHNEPFYLIDPLYSCNSIDLVHMFASIDGIYSMTGANWLVLPLNNWQKDIVSWAGDLQTVASKTVISNDLSGEERIIALAEAKAKDDMFISILAGGATFEQAFFERETSFSLEDMMADVDAMNVTKFYLDLSSYGVSKCISEYYNYNMNNYHGRFVDFLWSSTRDNQGFSGSINEIFENKVYLFLGIDKNDYSADFVLENDTNPTTIDEFIRKNQYGLIKEKFDVPTRRIIANIFIDYIYREIGNE
ncbi:MAG: hypothetical protein VB015_03780 [Erysipelotrichaceae bacterium]|nr:hypothetical protein [Erysipelotrichaceae bacterium]